MMTSYFLFSFGSLPFHTAINHYIRDYFPSSLSISLLLYVGMVANEDRSHVTNHNRYRLTLTSFIPYSFPIHFHLSASINLLLSILNGELGRINISRVLTLVGRDGDRLIASLDSLVT